MAAKQYKFFQEDIFPEPGDDFSSKFNSNSQSLDLVDINFYRKKQQAQIQKQCKSIEEIAPQINTAPEQDVELEKISVNYIQQEQITPREFKITSHFWYIIVLIALLPLLKSGISNTFIVSKNITRNFKLSKQRAQLLKDKAQVQEKIHEYHSQSGMKRTIKEEIKVLEKNEILIKLQN